MFSIKNYLKKDELAKSGGIIFFASIIAGFFNYLYQIYMGRVLGPEEYGVFGALFAIFYIFGVISSTLGTSTTRFVSKFVGEGKQIGFFIKKSIKHMILFGIIISIIFLILDDNIMKIFKITDHKPVLILVLILFLICIETIFGGTLRGVKRFKVLGFINISNTFCKMIFGILLVSIGFGVSGALMGVALGAIVGLVISFIFVRPYIRPNNPHDPEFRSRDFYFYSFPVLIAMIGYSVPSNLDVILAKYFFSNIEAGLYASVSVLGKIIFFFPGAIGTVIFPMITEKYVKGEDGLDILKKGIIYTGVLSGSLMVGYAIFPDIVIKMFGDRYVDAVSLVVPYGMAMFFFSLIGIMVNYHLAIKNLRYIIMFTVFIGIVVVMMMTFHSSAAEMINVLVIGNLIFFIMSMIYTFRGVVRIA